MFLPVEVQVDLQRKLESTTLSLTDPDPDMTFKTSLGLGHGTVKLSGQIPRVSRCKIVDPDGGGGWLLEVFFVCLQCWQVMGFLWDFSWFFLDFPYNFGNTFWMLNGLYEFPQKASLPNNTVSTWGTPGLLLESFQGAGSDLVLGSGGSELTNANGSLNSSKNHWSQNMAAWILNKLDPSIWFHFAAASWALELGKNISPLLWEILGNPGTFVSRADAEK